jgi:CheY-like chemotaxis protein
MNKTILIVDDSDFVVQMLCFTLEQEGYNTLAGVDGVDALKHFDGQHIDMVITDLNMPNLDGLGLINSIRLQAAYQYSHRSVRFIPYRGCRIPAKYRRQRINVKRSDGRTAYFNG